MKHLIATAACALVLSSTSGCYWFSQHAGHQVPKDPAARDAAQTAAEDKDSIKKPSGLSYTVRQAGTVSGREAQKGDRVTVHYTGWLLDGTKFDSSVDRNEPFRFVLGTGQVIKGWDEGVEGMRVGEKRKLVIPSALAYGPRGAGDSIPPNSVLVFDVELLAIGQ